MMTTSAVTGFHPAFILCEQQHQHLAVLFVGSWQTNLHHSHRPPHTLVFTVHLDVELICTKIDILVAYPGEREKETGTIHQQCHKSDSAGMGKRRERQADGQLLQMMSVRKVGEWLSGPRKRTMDRN